MIPKSTKTTIIVPRTDATIAVVRREVESFIVPTLDAAGVELGVVLAIVAPECIWEDVDDDKPVLTGTIRK